MEEERGGKREGEGKEREEGGHHNTSQKGKCINWGSLENLADINIVSHLCGLVFMHLARLSCHRILANTCSYPDVAYHVDIDSEILHS